MKNRRTANRFDFGLTNKQQATWIDARRWDKNNYDPYYKAEIYDGLLNWAIVRLEYNKFNARQ